MKQHIFIADDGRRITCSVWDKVKNPIGVIQIIHGMDEDIRRYDAFARFLNANRYIVFGDDHRGHGRTAGTTKNIGKTGGNTDIFAATVADELGILKYLKQKYRLPVLVFGHGYGSFITQTLLGQTKLCTAGVCMAGSARYPCATLWTATAIAWIGKTIWGMDACARFIEFWSPVRGVVHGGAKCMSRVDTEIKRHERMNNPRKCFSYGFYYSLFKNLMRINYDVCPTMPLLIISGGRDIVNMNGRLARALYNAYNVHDLENLTLIIYPDARHELLFDLDRDTVQRDILEFLNDAINKK